MPARMSKIEKAKERLRQQPKDYTYTEARNLLVALGFEERNKGRTSGSRVRFYRTKDEAIIDLHKPHPSDIMKEYSVKQLKAVLLEYGEL